VLRAQGNGSGRQRLRSDMTHRPMRPPRGMFLSTGEDIPNGASLRARLLLIELTPTDVDLAKMTACQRDGANGLYAQAMASYVRWLAPQYEQAQRDARSQILQLREQAQDAKQHGRTPEIVANLMVGMRSFLRFAREQDALSAEEVAEYDRKTWDALAFVARQQRQHQIASDPTQRFIELLRAALTSFQAHVAMTDGQRPDECGVLGWKEHYEGVWPTGQSEWQAQGPRVGWIDGEQLYLTPDAAVQAVQRVGQGSANPIAVSLQTLGKRLRESGLLASVDRARETIKVRRVCEGQQQEVWHLHIDSLFPRSEPDKPDKPDIDPKWQPGEREEPQKAATKPDIATGKTRQPDSHPTASIPEFMRFADVNVGNVGFYSHGESLAGDIAADVAQNAVGNVGSPSLRKPDIDPKPDIAPPGAPLLTVIDCQPGVGIGIAPNVALHIVDAGRVAMQSNSALVATADVQEPPEPDGRWVKVNLRPCPAFDYSTWCEPDPANAQRCIHCKQPLPTAA
jgi:hypothetical protein